MTVKKVPGTKISNDLALHELWQSLMGPGAFGRRTLWMLLLDRESRVTPVIVPIDDIPTEPDEQTVTGLVDAVTNLMEFNEIGSAAWCLSRPGPGFMTESDRRWAGALTSAFGALSPWKVHLATAGRVHVFAPDDLMMAC